MIRRKILGVMVGCALSSAAASVSAGQITLFENPNFDGRALATGAAVGDLQGSVLHRTASSMVIGEGSWEACTEPYFHGRCGRFTSGSYNGLGGEFSGVIASVRQVGYDTGAPQAFVEPDPRPLAIAPGSAPIVINPGAGPVVINPGAVPVVVSSDPRQPVVSPPVVTAPTVIAAPPIGNTRIVLYERASRNGRAVELTSNVDDLDYRHFQRRATAAFVSGGVWRLCEREQGGGYCADFSPGRYDSLGQLDGKVTSAYIVAAAPVGVSVPAVESTGRIVLYQYPNFAGPSAVVEHGRAPDLDWAKFKDRAASLRVDSGTWLVCSNIGYEGDCRIVGPGSYPQLSGWLNQGVYSAREVWRPEYGAADLYYRRP